MYSKRKAMLHGGNKRLQSKIMQSSVTFLNLQSLYMLVGGLNPSEKYEFVSWDDDIPIYGKS